MWALLGLHSTLSHSGSMLNTSWAVEDSSASQPGHQPMEGGQDSESEFRYIDPDSVAIYPPLLSSTKVHFSTSPFC